MKGMIVHMWSNQISHQGKDYIGKAQVFPDGHVKFFDYQSSFHRQQFPSQLLAIRHLQQKGWALSETYLWEEAEA